MRLSFPQMAIREFDTGWKRELHAEWIAAAAPDFLNTLGVDYERDFLDTLTRAANSSNPYSESIWKIVPNSAIPTGVLHCYPKVVDADLVTWEEWFLLEGKIRHHILSNHPFPSEEGVWTPEPGDQDHPKEVIFTSWHYMNSQDHKPALFNC